MLRSNAGAIIAHGGNPRRKKAEVCSNSRISSVAVLIDKSMPSSDGILSKGRRAELSERDTVRWFGRHLADFLTATAPYDSSPAAAEMARFEWALGEAFDAPNATPVPAAELIALPAEAWETLSFVPLPSLHRLLLSFEVPQAWQKREQVEPGDLEVAAASGPVPWVIWRPERTTHFRSLEPDEADMLEAMVEGWTFPEMCGALLPHVGEDQAPARAAGVLRDWVEAGMIATFAHLASVSTGAPQAPCLPGSQPAGVRTLLA